MVEKFCLSVVEHGETLAEVLKNVQKAIAQYGSDTVVYVDELGAFITYTKKVAYV